MARPEPTVKVSSDSRAPDWAWQRAQRMHESQALSIDVKAQRATDQREARRQRRNKQTESGRPPE